MLLLMCENGAANILGYDVRQPSVATEVPHFVSVFFTDDVCHGSSGKGDPKPTADFLEIKPEVNSSLILKEEFSNLSCRRHFARLF